VNCTKIAFIRSTFSAPNAPNVVWLCPDPTWELKRSQDLLVMAGEGMGIKEGRKRWRGKKKRKGGKEGKA